MMAGQFVGPCRLAARHGTTSSNPISSKRRVFCEPEFLDQTRKDVKCIGAIIDLYYWTTPNGHKVTIFLKETGLAYRILPVNISKGEQFKPDFLRISQQSDPCDRRHRSGGGRPAGP